MTKEFEEIVCLATTCTYCSTVGWILHDLYEIEIILYH